LSTSSFDINVFTARSHDNSVIKLSYLIIALYSGTFSMVRRSTVINIHCDIPTLGSVLVIVFASVLIPEVCSVTVVFSSMLPMIKLPNNTITPAVILPSTCTVNSI